MFQRILLAVDGSEPAKRAVAVAAELARLSGGELLIVHVHLRQPARGTAELHEIVVMRSGHSGTSEAEGAQILDDALAQVSQAGGTARTELLLPEAGADVADGLRAAIDEFGADTIVMGSRAYGARSGLMGESIARKMLHSAGLPVCAVP